MKVRRELNQFCLKKGKGKIFSVITYGCFILHNGNNCNHDNYLVKKYYEYEYILCSNFLAIGKITFI